MPIRYSKLADKLRKKTTSQLKKAAKKSAGFFKGLAGKVFKKGVDKSSDAELAAMTTHKGIPKIGHIYNFNYPNPKYKTKLPYWDALPLVIPIGYQGKDKFLGLNLHYISPKLRARLFDALLSFEAKSSNSEGKVDEARYLKLSYSLLRNMGSSIYAPTIHSYIYTRIKSDFINIPLESASELIMLPTENFKKFTEESGTNDYNKHLVWDDSARKM